MSDKIQLKNVRLSFPSLFSRATFEGKETKFEATFLIDKKDEATKARLDKAIKEAMKGKDFKVKRDRICLKNGDNAEYDGYEGTWSLKASSKKRPTVIDRDKTPLAEDDEVVYAGCYVNAIIDFWVQNNSYGKRINANLYGVQFVKDGEAFGSGSIDVTDEFDEIDFDDEDDEDDEDDDVEV